MGRQRRQPRPTRGGGRLCILHGTKCRWAGGDGTLERNVDKMLAATGYPLSDAARDPGCHQATEADRAYGLGIFVSRPSAAEVRDDLRCTLFTILREGEKADSAGVDETRLGAAANTVMLIQSLEARAAGVDIDALFAEVDEAWESGVRA